MFAIMTMSNELDNKNPYRKIKQRLLLVGASLAIIFILISIYLYRYISSNNIEYNKIVLSQRQNSYNQERVESKRGNIMDANGKVLATSKKVYNLIIDPYIINSGDKNAYVNATVAALNECYGYDISELYDIINNRKESKYVRYRKALSYDEKSKFEEYANRKNDEFRRLKVKDRVRGVWFEEEYNRVYPYKELASNVIGFINNEGKGTMGFELFYEDELKGTSGKSFAFLNDEYNVESVERDVIDGNNIITTIDFDIQSIVENNINKWQKEDIGSKDCAVIVMDPSNGEIKAMATSNTFDLNNPRNLDMYTEEEIFEMGKNILLKEYVKANQVPKEEIENINILEHFSADEIKNRAIENIYFKSWKNYCIQNTYEPGSTTKVFTVSGALEENTVNKDTTFLCEGKIELNDGEHTWTIRCNNRSGHGELDLSDAVAVSCNMSMAEIGEGLGITDFCKYQEIFGFGQKTNIDLPYEADTEKLVYDKNTMGRTSLATNSFGQNFNTTMIQVITAYASIINGGSLYEPHIVKRIENSKGDILKEIDKKEIRKTVSEKTSKFIRDTLIKTVEVGTGKVAQIDGVVVGGKTGTAEKLPRVDKNYVVSFCGFAEKDGKDLLCYVVVDEPNLEGEAQAKSSFATKIFRSIMKDIINDKNVYLDKTAEFVSYENFNIEAATVSNAIKVTFSQDNKANSNKSKFKNVTDELVIKKGEGGSGLPDFMPQ